MTTSWSERGYGQGSSREHAAIVPRYLGLRAVLAKSIARIHGQNLVNAVLMTFTDPGDYDRIDQGDARDRRAGRAATPRRARPRS